MIALCDSPTGIPVILTSNLPKVCDIARRSERVLDVGGWFQPFNLATHVIDLFPHETRKAAHALDPENAERFSRDSWVEHDVCAPPWPFEDNFFDFSFCSHLLEDVRDPIAVCGELIRVSKAGYIETPSRVREIFSKSRFHRLNMALGRLPEVGFEHHRWFCELDGDHLRFIAKDQRVLRDRSRYITRSEIGRKLSEAESGLGFFWQGSFTYEESLEGSDDDLTAFKRRTAAALR